MPTINWKAVVSASLIAGFIFLILDLALVAVVGGESLWGPPRMIGAILLGEGVLPPPATFHAGSFLAALVVHLALSLIYGTIFAWVANRAGWSLSASTLIGLLFGLAIYAVNFYGMTAFSPGSPRPGTGSASLPMPCSAWCSATPIASSRPTS